MAATATPIENVRTTLRRFGPVSHYGAVDSVTDIAIRVEDRLGALEVGARVEIETVSGDVAARECASTARSHR